LEINTKRLLSRLQELGEIGRNSQGQLSRLAASDEDKLARDQLVKWMQQAELQIEIDRIGNIFAIWSPDSVSEIQPIMMGSHIDTVKNAGIYDGSYGVLAGLEIIESLKEANFVPVRPIVVAAFTNEEGARYTPDMMGSLVYAGGLDIDQALATKGNDDSILGQELQRIGYAGEKQPGFLLPNAYLEIHIEQGPILEHAGISIGVVENLQGISWQRLIVKGVANHAGTTPMSLRHDAGLVAADIMLYLRDYVLKKAEDMVATVGCLSLEPNIINVIPSKSSFTVDIRSPDEEQLIQAEKALEQYIAELAMKQGVTITSEILARFEPVVFDSNLVQTIEEVAKNQSLVAKRMTSGAGHDAQMMARICPSAMIFVPSKNGISHNPGEYTEPEDLVAGAVLGFEVVKLLSAK